MPQNTNLNVSPYFDDFNENKNYHKVLFKPGFPVQARELTTLQSILQNQIEKFGQHFFKEGSMVIPGGVTYDRFFEAVKINPNGFEALNNLGSIHVRNKNYQFAQKCFEKSYTINNNYVPVINNLASLFHKLQNKNYKIIVPFPRLKII